MVGQMDIYGSGSEGTIFDVKIASYSHTLSYIY